MWKVATQILGSLQAVVCYAPEKPATHLVVLCHGFGAPGDDLVGLADLIAERSDRLAISPLLIFPQAPIDLADEGMPGGRAWWRLNMTQLLMMAESGGFDELRDQQPPGMESARAALEELVTLARQSYGLEDTPLILAGFSQGAMLSVDLALRGAIEPPQGLVIYSGALLCESAWRQASGRLADTRVFQSHGTQDMILPIETGRWLHELIQEKAIEAHWFSFTGPHTIPMQGIDGMMELLVAIGTEKA